VRGLRCGRGVASATTRCSTCFPIEAGFNLADRPGAHAAPFSRNGPAVRRLEEATVGESSTLLLQKGGEISHRFSLARYSRGEKLRAGYPTLAPYIDPVRFQTTQKDGR
jgi:hypothetical protein